MSPMHRARAEWHVVCGELDAAFAAETPQRVHDSQNVCMVALPCCTLPMKNMRLFRVAVGRQLDDDHQVNAARSSVKCV